MHSSIVISKLEFSNICHKIIHQAIQASWGDEAVAPAQVLKYCETISTIQGAMQGKLEIKKDQKYFEDFACKTGLFVRGLDSIIIYTK